MSTKYAYLVTDTVNDIVDVGALTQEIQDSSITIALDYIQVVGNALDIYFKADLSAGEQTTLTTVVEAHTGEPLPDVVEVHPDLATLEHPDGQEVQRVAVQPGRTGYYMCDRDILVKTAMYADSDAVEDLKVVNATNKQEDWGEFSLVGCYKKSGEDYVLCTDQTDAAANAVLSVFDYVAKDQTTESPVEYDFKGGALWADSALNGNVWEHRMYAVMAPNLTPAQGGSVRFFDGYLYPYEGKWQEAVNSLSLKIDPSQSVEAARVRFWIYYPQGVGQNHVLRIITYRKPETF